MIPPIPQGWQPGLQPATQRESYRGLVAHLARDAAAGKTILPAPTNILNALALTPLTSVRVVLLGQDPYPTPGHAHGLCFSVLPHVRPIARSLQNIFKELRDDLGFRIPNHGFLESWARQGVLLLNTVLTVRAGEPNSHKDKGWEDFTTSILELVNAQPHRVVFLLWGKEAQKKRHQITAPQHVVLEAAHPSPLSARKFFGCRCFSKANTHLIEAGLPPIDWQLSDL